MGTKFEGVDILDFLGQVVELHPKGGLIRRTGGAAPSLDVTALRHLLFERAGGVFTG